MIKCLKHSRSNYRSTENYLSVEFNGTHLNASAMTRYLEYLEKDYGIKGLWWSTSARCGQLRCIIKYTQNNGKAQLYFSDRCPAIIEAEARKFVKITDGIVPRGERPADEDDIMCYVTGLPKAEYYTVLTEEGKLKYPIMILIDSTESGIYTFRIGIPENFKCNLDEQKIKQFLIDFCKDLYINNTTNMEFSEYSIRITCMTFNDNFPRTAEFELQNLDYLFGAYLKVQKDIDCKRQLHSELNIKLRNYDFSLV